VTDVEGIIRRDLAAQLKQSVDAVRPIPEGHSGFTYWVDLEGRRAVLRLPPPGARIAGPADIPRQARIMDALHRQGLPVPGIIATSAEPVVDQRPFVLMEALPGVRVEPAIADGADPRQLAMSAVDILRRIQATPLKSTGIAGEEPVSIEAELGRWAWLMERAPQELTTHGPRLASLLADQRPRPQAPVLVHGDYHLGNMLFLDGRVSAVVDWEIAELGQPLLDPCCIALSHVAAEVVLDAYGGDPNDFRWYRALMCFKYAAILGYNLMLHRRGKRPDPSYEQRTETILEFIEQGVGLLS